MIKKIHKGLTLGRISSRNLYKRSQNKLLGNLKRFKESLPIHIAPTRPYLEYKKKVTQDQNLFFIDI